jgi:cobalt transporter subunit CbtB
MSRPGLSTTHPVSTATGTTAAGSRPRSLEAALPPLLAILLGLLIVGVSGFSHLDIVHNASHDTRHSNAFPCH